MAGQSTSTSTKLSTEIAYVIGASLIVAIALHLYSQRFLDDDSFYHFKHAGIYLSRGPLYGRFPWTAYSVMAEGGGDLWYGFHILLMPFALLPVIVGLKLAGIVLTVTGLCLVYLAARIQGFAWPWLWGFASTFAGPMSTVRWMAVRPQALSVPLAGLLLVLLINRRPWWQIALVAFLIGWIHLALVWLVPVVVAASVAAVVLTERKLLISGPLVSFVGVILAWVARPEPLAAAKLAYIQIFVLSDLVRRGVPVLFADEVSKLTNAELGFNYLIFLTVWVAAILMLVAVALKRLPFPLPQRAFCLAVGLLSVGFFELATVSTLRGVEPWTVFGSLLVGGAASVWGSALQDASMDVRRRLKTVPVIVLGVVVLGAVRSIWLVFPAYEAQGVDLMRSKPAMDWLAANSAKDAIVFHANWSQFPKLFIWNDHNRFIGGMDPVFMYAHDQGRYWEFQRLETGVAVEKTSTAGPGQPKVNRDTFDVLKQDFNANYIVVFKEDNPALYDYVHTEPRYHVCQESADVVLCSLSG